VTEPPYFRIETSVDGDVLTIAASGELDLASAPRLTEAIVSADETAASSIVIDLTGVTFVDSVGIRVLLQASRTYAGRLRIRPGQGSQVARILEVTAVDELLPFE
jgi:anti-sigma B factor antagonist